MLLDIIYFNKANERGGDRILRIKLPLEDFRLTAFGLISSGNKKEYTFIQYYKLFLTTV